MIAFSMQAFGAYKQGTTASALKQRDYKDTTDLVIGRGDKMKAQVRRITPTECERLQAFPDGWTDIGAWEEPNGKKHKESTDSARYRALGNSIATPFWAWLLGRIAAEYDRPATLGSLFDGIGGFPLCWAKHEGPDTVIWASEIEPFCVAVTKRHFGDDEAGTKGDYHEAVKRMHNKDL